MVLVAIAWLTASGQGSRAWLGLGAGVALFAGLGLLDDLCAIVKAEFGVSYRPEGLSKLIKKNGFSRQKPRPHHPKTNLACQEAFKKRCRHSQANCSST